MRLVWMFLITAALPAYAQPDTTEQNLTRTRMAVVPFKNNTGSKQFEIITAGIAESITTALSGSGKFDFVERLQVDKALSEQDFQMTDLVDSKTVQSMGAILGVEYIIIGDLQKIGTRFRINARRMRVSDGKLAESASASGEEDDLFDMQDEVAEKLIEQFEQRNEK
ncbi:MAG TPA: CsgG/HfaB family protein [bacterium]|nr:CsgG/HfaB family protein [bacterium]HMW32209.1 CsgG/HfaB family protein [bacterium]HMW35335.1 CsgG/HfaB family protein [bacterium]HMY34671.1 CsgG/HfaB family protein [bacterium]HMZ04020.1 CsgG/HfaB family protein [bacterium]